MSHIPYAAFSIKKTATQLNIPNNTWTKVTFEAATIDTHSGFDNVNDMYVFPFSGYWLIGAQLRTHMSTDNRPFYFYICEHATSPSNVRGIFRYQSGLGSAHYHTHQVVRGNYYFAAGDPLTLWFTHSNTDKTPDVYLNFTFMWGYYLGL